MEISGCCTIIRSQVKIYWRCFIAQSCAALKETEGNTLSSFPCGICHLGDSCAGWRGWLRLTCQPPLSQPCEALPSCVLKEPALLGSDLAGGLWGTVLPANVQGLFIENREPLPLRALQTSCPLRWPMTSGTLLGSLWRSCDTPFSWFPSG